MAEAVEGVLQNFPNRYFGLLCRIIIFPLGNYFVKPSDELKQEVVASVMKSDSLRKGFVCFVLWSSRMSLDLLKLKKHF